jgi:glycosyltransferase involved in cell wall biosynthesis
LYLGYRLIKKGKKVAFDFEDWYSEDLLNEARINRPLKLLKKAEAYALKNGAYVQTTSHVLADALANAYNATKPYVVYNTFNTSGVSPAYHDRKNLNVPSLYWFSQTIGPGRGIETVIEALKKVDHPLELHLRGQCSATYNAFLVQLHGVETQHKLYVHSLLSNDQLGAGIKEHDIGLAFEYHQPLNRDLTVTNKIFHYLVNKIPVIASPTSGQCEVEALAAGCVFITEDFSSNALADSINRLLAKPEMINRAKQLLNKLSEKINWDTEQNKLLQIVTDILEK